MSDALAEGMTTPTEIDANDFAELTSQITEFFKPVQELQVAAQGLFNIVKSKFNSVELSRLTTGEQLDLVAAYRSLEDLLRVRSKWEPCFSRTQTEVATEP